MYNRFLDIAFCLISLSAAFLLFLVQPIFSKLITPEFGGASSVWTACMLFFQLTLLLGYYYSYILTKYVRANVQAFIHSLVLIGGLTSLSFGRIDGIESLSNPVFQIIKLASTSIGIPFFIISTTAPLLQVWYANIKDDEKRSPYFLYAASNLGSFFALILYPSVFERICKVDFQINLWIKAYIALLISLLILAAFRLRALVTDSSSKLSESPLPLDIRLVWLILAFIPSSLMLGLTHFVTTDIAPITLFWIVPLGLYLLSFVLAFSERLNLDVKILSRCVYFLIIVFLILSFKHTQHPLYFIAVNVLLYFILSLFYASSLYRMRPDSNSLPRFYLYLSIGGALGGVFNSIISPLLFKLSLEYWIILLLSIFILPLIVRLGDGYKALMRGIFMRFSFLLATFLLFQVCITNQLISNSNIFLGRSFYGSIRVEELVGDQSVIHEMYHGNTTHGGQIIKPESRNRELNFYYNDKGAFGDIRRVYIDSNRSSGLNIAVIGLGSGNLACVGKEGDNVDFFEIDPLVERVARDENYFSFLKICPANVIIGDGRLMLKTKPNAFYDLIFMDAFSGDAVPTHLLTKEALDIYFSKIRQGGILVFHISNRFLDLKKVVANMVLPEGYIPIVSEVKECGENCHAHILSAIVRDDDNSQKLLQSGKWRRLEKEASFSSWTDGFSNLLDVLVLN